jgi:hypothetical protein
MRWSHKNAILVPAIGRHALQKCFLYVGGLDWYFPVRYYEKMAGAAGTEAFDRTPARLYYYAFALCRMQCLHISKKDILTIMEKGVIHMNQSNRHRQPCATFTIQGRTGTGYIRARV